MISRLWGATQLIKSGSWVMPLLESFSLICMIMFVVILNVPPSIQIMAIFIPVVIFMMCLFAYTTQAEALFKSMSLSMIPNLKLSVIGALYLKFLSKFVLVSSVLFVSAHTSFEPLTILTTGLVVLAWYSLVLLGVMLVGSISLTLTVVLPASIPILTEALFSKEVAAYLLQFDLTTVLLSSFLVFIVCAVLLCAWALHKLDKFRIDVVLKEIITVLFPQRELIVARTKKHAVSLLMFGESAQFSHLMNRFFYSALVVIFIAEALHFTQDLSNESNVALMAMFGCFLLTSEFTIGGAYA